MKEANVELNSEKATRKKRKGAIDRESTAIVSTRVPKELHATIKAFASESGMSSSQLVSNLLHADMTRYMSIKDFAKQNKMSAVDIISNLLIADIKKMKSSTVKKKVVFSLLSKIPYVFVGLLAGFGMAIIAKDFIIPVLLDNIFPYIINLFN